MHDILINKLIYVKALNLKVEVPGSTFTPAKHLFIDFSCVEGEIVGKDYLITFYYDHMIPRTNV